MNLTKKTKQIGRVIREVIGKDKGKKKEKKEKKEKDKKHSFFFYDIARLMISQKCL